MCHYAVNWCDKVHFMRLNLLIYCWCRLQDNVSY